MGPKSLSRATRNWLGGVIFVLIIDQIGRQYNIATIVHSSFENASLHDQHVCICNGSATNIMEATSLSSPFFKKNDVLMLIGTDPMCCAGLEPDARNHVFFSVAHLAYGHFVFNGVAPLWDKLRSEQLLDYQSPLVLHLLAGNPHDPMAQQPYLLQYLNVFGGEANVVSPLSFREQRLLLLRRPVLGLANTTLDHYNAAASPQLWRGFRDFLIGGFPLVRDRHEQLVNSSLRRITVVQREANRKFLNLNSTIADVKTLLRNIKEKSFTVRVVQFEGMAVAEQAMVMSETDILIAADGTAILNGIYLPKNHSCIISVIPYGVHELIPGKGRNFVTLFTKLGMKYYTIDSSPVNQSLETYRLAAAKETSIERWFMLKQDLNISGLQLFTKVQSCLEVDT